VKLSSNKRIYDPGNAVVIRGEITNKNDYPIIGLDIKARLVKDIPEPDKNRSEILILDEFNIVEDINLNSGDSYDISYSHLLPVNSPSGQYRLYFYAVEQDKFNLSGVPYASEIAATKISFDVSGDNSDHIYLDQTQIEINETPYNVKNHEALVSSEDKIEITVPLYNPHDTATQMDVTYDLYSFDSSSVENKINTKTEKVLVPSKGEYLLSYVINKPEIPVYYLSITSKPSNQTKDESVYKEKTISNVRFSVDGIYEPRLIFAGVDSYPIKSGSALVTCFNGIGGTEKEDNYKIETIVQDENGKEISRELYSGFISSDMTGLIQKIKTSKTLSDFTVLSTVYNPDGTVLEKVSKKYSCQDLNPESCSQDEPTPTSGWLILLVSVFLVILIAVVFFKRKTINIERV